MKFRLKKIFISALGWVMLQVCASVSAQVIPDFPHDWSMSDLRPYLGGEINYNNTRFSETTQLQFPEAKNHNVGTGVYLGLRFNRCLGTEIGYNFVEAIKLAPGLKHMRVQMPYWVMQFNMVCFNNFTPYLVLGVGRPKVFIPMTESVARYGFRGGVGIEWPFCDKQVLLRGFSNYQKMDSGHQGVRWNINFGLGLAIDIVELLYHLGIG